MKGKVALPSLLLLLCSVCFALGEHVDYCNKKLCKPYLRHITCGHSGEINRTCAANSEIIKLTPAIKANIIRKHNEYRNQIALGKVPLFRPAARMATMQWHDELAKMADLNVKTCTGTHDNCRNTFNFRHSGQNIARRTTDSGSMTMNQLEYNIYHGIDRWFREHSFCPIDKSMTYSSRLKDCGHFTIMIAEQNTHVGCAAILMKGQKTVFTCNYAWTNMRRTKMYHSGQATSGCATGKNSNYPGLCSKNEKYE